LCVRPILLTVSSKKLSVTRPRFVFRWQCNEPC
jgi:hypothetical protein